MSIRSTLLLSFLFPCLLAAQSLPLEVNLTEDGRLTHGGNITEGFYKTADIHKLEITLTEPDWFELLDGPGGPGGNAGETLIGVLTFNDDLVLDSVLVSIKGQTSDRQNNSEKKSFKIEIDEILDQDLMGYDNLNLNCAFQDHSSMREVLYYDISRAFAPALKGSFVDLYINGQYWGPYNNIQQIEGRYIQEWFTDNDGTRWRAVSPDGVGGGGPGGPGGPGGAFGTGVSTLNYNGPDSTDYNENYTLKKTSKENPWEDLIAVCDDLNHLPIDDLYEGLKHSLDIDRTMWFLAQEAVFSDDDSYLHKGGMDYYVYWDNATNRLMPLEVDGNSVLASNNITWSPFYHETDERFPLLNRLLQNTEVRQRYLAHLRTVLDLYFIEEDIHDRIDEFAVILDQRVQDDPKKIYSYTQFVNGVESLKELISDRITFLQNHTEINRQGVEIANALMETSAGVGLPPLPEEEVQVTVEVGADAQSVILYYGLGLDGAFERIPMYDDGMHGDQAAGDNIYGALIPAYQSGTYVRYYFEAIKDDEFSTASYFPKGAEHDVFVYRVEASVVPSENVVINEFMADNEASVADDAGEYDDWVELYNKGIEAVDLTGYFMSDNESEITKWRFPDGTIIGPDEYLIVWADEDEDQASDTELHADFKISAGGEELLLVDAEMQIIDAIYFGEQEEDRTFARRPNGIGDFTAGEPTFNANNDDITSTTTVSDEQRLFIAPNPTSNHFTVGLEGEFTENLELTIFNTAGQIILRQQVNANAQVDARAMESGTYFVVLHDPVKQVNYRQKLVIVK
ncbi:MAG: CotH kinase family protein [Bacteroidota bacterium]